MSDRRTFVRSTVAAGLGAVVVGFQPAQGDDKKAVNTAEVSPAEDLMREHGVLNRVLLVYEEAIRRMHAKEDVTPEMFKSPANLVRKFVEDYHEQLEERHLFPAFEKKQILTDLIGVLRKQHKAGRDLTDVILRESVPDRFRNEESRKGLAAAATAFIRMYRPHEAREDTVLFPALPKVFPAKGLEELGERFEKEEDRLFGEEGFHKVVDQVATIEKQLGIYDLSQFTPTLSVRK
jgi:hemerythrin-like domain-containing protein